MRKLYIAMAALALSLTAAHAQKFVKQPSQAVKAERTQGYNAFAPKAEVNKAPKKALAANQRYVGLDLEDDVPGAQDGLGLPRYASYVKGVGSELGSDLLGTYNGCKVIGMRYGLCYAATVSRLFVTPIGKDGYLHDDLKSVSLTGSSKAGWNEVLFDEPFTLDTTTVSGLLIGFDYTQLSSNTNAAYPLALTGTGENGGFLVYMNSQFPSYYGGEGWYPMDTSYGNLCVQLLVERESDFDPYDISLKAAYPFPFSKVGEQKEVYVVCKNVGSKTITSSEFGIEIDGKDAGSYTSTTSVGSSKAYIKVPVTVPSDLAVGEHSLKIYAKSVEGAAPVGNKGDDAITTSFKVYSESFAHQKQLVEHFTSQYCTYCPYGYNNLNALCDMRDDVAWVSVHGNMSSGTDIYTVSEGAYILSYATTGYPSAAFNRYWIVGSDEIATTISYQNATTGANYLSQVIDVSNADYPAFATVNISTKYDASTRKLDVTVSGDLTNEWKETLGEDAVVTVYLTEDSLVSKQLNGSTWIQKYPHNHVLRKVVSSPLGDVLKVADDNSYENTYNVALGMQWKPKNMNVVAFVSRPIIYDTTQQAFTTAIDDAWVTNTNSVILYDETAGIEGIQSAGAEGVETVRYNVNGVRLDAPAKGLNIVKYSDGTVRKEMVK